MNDVALLDGRGCDQSVPDIRHEPGSEVQKTMWIGWIRLATSALPLA